MSAPPDGVGRSSTPRTFDHAESGVVVGVPWHFTATAEGGKVCLAFDSSPAKLSLPIQLARSMPCRRLDPSDIFDVTVTTDAPGMGYGYSDGFVGTGIDAVRGDFRDGRVLTAHPVNRSFVFVFQGTGLHRLSFIHAGKVVDGCVTDSPDDSHSC
jgi:hypothetical protein